MRNLLFILSIICLTSCNNKPTTIPTAKTVTDSLTAVEDSEFVETLKDIPVPGK